MSKPKVTISQYYKPAEKQPSKPESWREEWEGMPEFVQEKLEPYATLIIRFASEEAIEEFSKLIGQAVNKNTKHIWHPKLVRGFDVDKRYS
jgi:hypothetical protein